MKPFFNLITRVVPAGFLADRVALPVFYNTSPYRLEGQGLFDSPGASLKNGLFNLRNLI